jgi:hypothetical protein
MIHWPLTDTHVLIAAILALTLVVLITLPLELWAKVGDGVKG